MAASKTGTARAQPTSQSDAVTHKFVATVLAALSGGPLSRADLMKAVFQRLAGDVDSNAIAGMLVNDQFHRGKPWLYDGMWAGLPQHEDQFRRLSQRDKVPWHHGLISEIANMFTSALVAGVILLAALGVIGLLMFGLRQLF
jgi:hypothetical protein